MIRAIQSLVADVLPVTMSIEDAAGLLGISRSMAHSEAARFRRTGGVVGIPSAALGSEVVVLTAPLMDMLMLRSVSPELVLSADDAGPVSP